MSDLTSIKTIDPNDLDSHVSVFLDACCEVSDSTNHGVLIYRSEGRCVIELIALNTTEDDDDDDWDEYDAG